MVMILPQVRSIGPLKTGPYAHWLPPTRILDSRLLNGLEIRHLIRHLSAFSPASCTAFSAVPFPRVHYKRLLIPISFT